MAYPKGRGSGFKFRKVWVRIPPSLRKIEMSKKGAVLSNAKKTWEMTYDELFEDWSSRYSFGAKGEMTLQEAREFHNKWKRLGTAARRGTL